MDERREQTRGSSYAGSGVDIDESNRAKERIRELVRSTYTSGVLSEIGLFGGLFEPDFRSARQPVLVSSADGVGTKLKVAFAAGVYDTVGYDLVSHCINDILVQGAYPLFFLDYLAGGKLEAGVVASLVEGLARACRETGCALIGGETAEMPGFYAEGEYDLAGFIVGLVDKDRVLDGRRVRPGDTVLGLPSLGLHTNGYSLARQIMFEDRKHGVHEVVPELGCTVGAELLKPHKCYLGVLRGCLDRDLVSGLAHITGGGLLENIPRILPENCSVEVRKGAWPVLPVFEFLQRAGSVDEREMFRVFNMGIGMVVIVPSENRDAVVEHFRGLGEAVFEIGRVVSGKREVVLS